MSLKDLTIVIPFRAQDARRKMLFDWILNRYKSIMPESQIVIADSDPGQPFSRSQSRNVGVDAVKTNYILLADADTIPYRPFIESSIDLLKTGANWVIPYGRKGFYVLKKPYSDKLLSQPVDTFTTPDFFEWDFNTESWGGLVLMSKSSFVKVNGYDERFKGWGFEDNAFQIAMDTIVGPFSRVEFGWSAHLWHAASNEDTWGQPHAELNQKILHEYRRRSGNVQAMLNFVKDNKPC